MTKYKVYSKADNSLIGEFAKEELESAKGLGAVLTEDISSESEVFYVLESGAMSKAPELTEENPSDLKEFTCFVAFKKYVKVKAKDRSEVMAALKSHDLGQYLETRDVRIEN